MLNHAGLPQALRHGIWAEAAETATLISNAVITRDKPTAPYVQFYKKETTYISSLEKLAWFETMHSKSKANSLTRDFTAYSWSMEPIMQTIALSC